MTSISIVLTYGDGLEALQTLSIITALPLVFIMLLMIASFVKWIRVDYDSIMIEQRKATSTSAAKEKAPEVKKQKSLDSSSFAPDARVDIK